MSDEIKPTLDWQPGRLLRIETSRFLLRSLVPEDATITYVSWWNDPEVQAGLNFLPRQWDRQRAMQHIAQFDNATKFHLGIFCKDSGRMIGFFAVFPNPNTRVAKTNIVIGEKDYWGKGVVQEVRPPLLAFLFAGMRMEKVKGEIQGRNYPSIFNYKKQGFTCEGILRKELPHYSGEGRADVFIFGLLREEWEAQQAAAASE
jgi:RimJ/RimL family protein N-acetyltransferase